MMDRALSFILQKLRAGSDRSQRIAQIVPQHRDELLAQFRGRAGVDKIGFRHRQSLAGIEVEGDQFCE